MSLGLCLGAGFADAEELKRMVLHAGKIAGIIQRGLFEALFWKLQFLYMLADGADEVVMMFAEELETVAPIAKSNAARQAFFDQARACAIYGNNIRTRYARMYFHGRKGSVCLGKSAQNVHAPARRLNALGTQNCS